MTKNDSFLACQICIKGGLARVEYGFTDHAPFRADVYADTSAGIIDAVRCDCCPRVNEDHGFSVQVCTKGEK